MIWIAVLLAIYSCVLLLLSSSLESDFSNKHILRVLGKMKVDYNYRELTDGKIEFVMKRKWIVNLVLSVSEGSSIPLIPAVDQRRIQFQNIIFVVSKETYNLNQNAFSRLGDSVNVTITNFVDDNDYLPVLLSFYYRSDSSIIVKVNGTNCDSMTTELANFINKSFYAQVSDPESTVITGTMESMGNDVSFICMSNIALRRLITYTDVTFSSPSLFSILPRIVLPSFPWSHVHLPSFSPFSSNSTPIQMEIMKCKPLEVTRNGSITVFLRTYQRNYVQRQINLLMQQTKPPQIIVIVQNRNLVDFSYEKLLRKVSPNVKLVYIWNYNWNAFFHLSYLISGMMPTDFSFTFDDDQLLRDPSTHQQVISSLVRHPAIYGMRKWCWCKKYYSERKMQSCLRQCATTTDLVVNPFFSYSFVAKYMWRYDIPTYFCCEEMSYLFSANIECGIKWHHLSIDYESYQMDQRDRSRDNYTIALMKRVKWKFIEHDAMNYYTHAGYCPVYRYDPRYASVARTIYPI